MKLDDFTEGYVEALFFVADEDDDTFEKVGSSFAFFEMQSESKEVIISDCKRFQQENARLLERSYRRLDDSGNLYYPRKAGVDFCFTRNEHGTGFWDSLKGPLGEQLTKRSRKFESQNIYVNEGKLHVETF